MVHVLVGGALGVGIVVLAALWIAVRDGLRQDHRGRH
jgi:hypothetical protein